MDPNVKMVISIHDVENNAQLTTVCSGSKLAMVSASTCHAFMYTPTNISVILLGTSARNRLPKMVALFDCHSNSRECSAAARFSDKGTRKVHAALAISMVLDGCKVHRPFDFLWGYLDRFGGFKAACMFSSILENTKLDDAPKKWWFGGPQD